MTGWHVGNNQLVSQQEASVTVEHIYQQDRILEPSASFSSGGGRPSNFSEYKSEKEEVLSLVNGYTDRGPGQHVDVFFAPLSNVLEPLVRHQPASLQETVFSLASKRLLSILTTHICYYGRSAT